MQWQHRVSRPEVTRGGPASVCTAAVGEMGKRPPQPPPRGGAPCVCPERHPGHCGHSRKDPAWLGERRAPPTPPWPHPVLRLWPQGRQLGSSMRAPRALAGVAGRCPRRLVLGSAGSGRRAARDRRAPPGPPPALPPWGWGLAPHACEPGPRVTEQAPQRVGPAQHPNPPVADPRAPRARPMRDPREGLALSGVQSPGGRGGSQGAVGFGGRRSPRAFVVTTTWWPAPWPRLQGTKLGSAR